MNVQHVYDDGLCMQCGTCEGVCPRGRHADVGPPYRLPPGRERAELHRLRPCLRRARARLRLLRGCVVAESATRAPPRGLPRPLAGLWFGWASDATCAPPRGVRRRRHGAACRRRSRAEPWSRRSSENERRQPLRAERVFCPRRGGRHLPRLEVQTCRHQPALRRVLQRARPLRPRRPAVPRPGAAPRAAPLPAAARARRAAASASSAASPRSPARPPSSPARQGSTLTTSAAVAYRGPGWPRAACGSMTRRGRSDGGRYPDYLDRQSWR